ncbi:M23 family metallopeptidase [Candidatus Babeliales bacterium]|nr:M23 family metallopeptidase [Candidatus Babeliales bacterium]
MNNQKTVLAFIYLIVLTITVGLAVLLLWEYRYFKREAQDLAQVKDAYYQHVEMLKRSLNASMSSDGEEEPESEIEKKKINDGDYVTVDFTVDATDEDVPSQFQIISREEEDRLKAIKSTITKLKVPPVVKQKRIPKKVFYKSLKQKTRYEPQRDFVFSWPIDLQNFWLSSLFGPRRRPNGHVEFHHAIDMAACKGTPVKAAASGKVILAQNLSGYGNCVMLEHNSRYKTRYAHLHRIMVRPGQMVDVGDVIGSVGDTGLVRKSGRDASHLHFEVHQDGRRVNPLGFLFG